MGHLFVLLYFAGSQHSSEWPNDPNVFKSPVDSPSRAAVFCLFIYVLLFYFIYFSHRQWFRVTTRLSLNGPYWLRVTKLPQCLSIPSGLTTLGPLFFVYLFLSRRQWFRVTTRLLLNGPYWLRVTKRPLCPRRVHQWPHNLRATFALFHFFFIIIILYADSDSEWPHGSR